MLGLIGQRRIISEDYLHGPPTCTIQQNMRWACGIAQFAAPACSQASSSSQGVWGMHGSSSTESSTQGRPTAPSKKTRSKSASSQGTEYLFRAMTEDLREFDERFTADSSYTGSSGEDLAFYALQAVAVGSQMAPPFLHFSYNFLEALKWYRKDQKFRNVRDSILCRVSLAKLSSAGALSQGMTVNQYIDFSSQKAAQKHLLPHLGSDRIQQSNYLTHLDQAHSNKEVLGFLAWFGFEGAFRGDRR